MHKHVSDNALLIGLCDYSLGCFGALPGRLLGPCEPSNARMHLPHSRRIGRRRKVPFDERSASLRSLRADDEIRELNMALLASLPDLDHGLGLLLVVEERSA